MQETFETRYSILQDLLYSFYRWLFLLFQSSLFDEFDLRNLQTSFHPRERCQIGESFWTHSQALALALQQSWVFVFRLVFSKWIGIIFMAKVIQIYLPWKFVLNHQKTNNPLGGRKSHPILLPSPCWRHWRREGWDFVDGFQGVIKATHLDKRRRFFTIFRWFRAWDPGAFFLLKDLRIPKRRSGRMVFGFQHFLGRFFRRETSKKSFCANLFFLGFYDGPNKKWTYQSWRNLKFDLMNPAHRFDKRWAPASCRWGYNPLGNPFEYPFRRSCIVGVIYIYCIQSYF